MDRGITPHEAEIVRWLLDHAAMGDISAYRARPVEELQVRPGCTCGCCSLNFEADGWARATIVADALAIYADGQQAGLILWGREGKLVLLEVYDCHPGASHRIPEIANLKSWEDRGRELL